MFEQIESPTTTHSRMMTYLFNLTCASFISAYFCSSYAGTHSMAWWLIPIALFALALRLVAGLASESTFGRLQKSTSEDLLELFVVALVALAALSCVLWRLQTIPLDSVTLDRLRSWEEQVQQTHEFFEAHKPDLKVFLSILGLLFFLRVLNRFIAPLKGFAQFLVASLVNGVKWTERLATVVAVAATLTFLATGPEGPSARIGLQLREAQKKYDEYQSVLSDCAEKALRRALVQKAWAQRPPNLVAEMHETVQFRKDWIQFVKLSQVARDTFKIQVEQYSNDAPPSLDGADHPGHSHSVPAPARRFLPRTASRVGWLWTTQSIESATQDAEAYVPGSVSELLKTESEASSDIGKEALAELLPVDKVFSASPLSLNLKEAYPAFGEFLDVIASALSETAFEKMRDVIVEKAAADRENDPHNGSLAQLMEALATGQVKDIQFEWKRFDHRWRQTTAAQIEAYSNRLRPIYTRLQELVSKKKQEEFKFNRGLEIVLREMLVRIGEDYYNDARLTPRLPADKKLGELIDEYQADLNELAKTWPAEGDPTPQQRESFQQIKNKLKQEDFVIIFFNSNEDAQHAWVSPTVLINFLQDYAWTAILKAVGKAGASSTESARLRKVLGDDLYSTVSREAKKEADRVKEVQEEKEREKQQQKHFDDIVREMNRARELPIE